MPFLRFSEGGPSALTPKPTQDWQVHPELWLNGMSPRLHFVLYHLAAYLRGINIRTIRPWSHSYITSTNFNNFIVLIWYYVELTKIMKLFSHPVPLQYRRPMCMVPYLPASCFALHLVRFSDEIEGGGRGAKERKYCLSPERRCQNVPFTTSELHRPTVLPTCTSLPSLHPI